MANQVDILFKEKKVLNRVGVVMLLTAIVGIVMTASEIRKGDFEFVYAVGFGFAVLEAGILIGAIAVKLALKRGSV